MDRTMPGCGPSYWRPHGRRAVIRPAWRRLSPVTNPAWGNIFEMKPARRWISTPPMSPSAIAARAAYASSSWTRRSPRIPCRQKWCPSSASMRASRSSCETYSTCHRKGVPNYCRCSKLLCASESEHRSPDARPEPQGAGVPQRDQGRIDRLQLTHCLTTRLCHHSSHPPRPPRDTTPSLGVASDGAGHADSSYAASYARHVRVGPITLLAARALVSRSVHPITVFVAF